MSIYLGDTPLADGASTALLAGKADTNLGNTIISSTFATKLNSAGIRTVVETYVNGTSWYRIWSDGWIEQGGENSGTKTVSLHKAFKNTNYNLQITAKLYSTHPCNVSTINGKATSTFNVKNAWCGSSSSGGDNSTGYSWYACGY